MCEVLVVGDMHAGAEQPLGSNAVVIGVKMPYTQDGGTGIKVSKDPHFSILRAYEIYLFIWQWVIGSL